MMIDKILRTLFFLTACFILLLSYGSRAEISAEEKEKIKNAIPEKALAQPKQTRKILVMNLHVRDGEVGYGHASTPCGNLALELMGQETGAYEITVSDDTLMFKKDNLAQFDALCFLNTAGLLCTDPALRMNIL
ncbi:hypothetical protein EH222_01850, partial [candidate division KSB1 bacterium]